MKDSGVSINDEKKTDSTMTDDAGKLTERQLAYAMLMPHWSHKKREKKIGQLALFPSHNQLLRVALLSE